MVPRAADLEDLADSVVANADAKEDRVSVSLTLEEIAGGRKRSR